MHTYWLNVFLVFFGNFISFLIQVLDCIFLISCFHIELFCCNKQICTVHIFKIILRKHVSTSLSVFLCREQLKLLFFLLLSNNY